MVHLLQRFSAQFYQIISHKWFYIGTLSLFALSSIWVALVSLYPMAFDEEFHIGLIKMYAEYLLPLGINVDGNYAQYGAAPVDPSYLFHYLMSFPWRFLTDVIGIDEVASIIILRLLNVMLFVFGLIVFRKVLGLFGASRFVQHTIIALVCLIPISPLIAGQVNYDNLMILQTAGAFYFAAKLILDAQKKQFRLANLFWLGIILLTGTATKYAFLPIAAGIALVVAIELIRKLNFQTLLAKLLVSLRKSKKILLIFGGLLLVICVALNGRYLTNVATYQAISPSCDTVFQHEDCMNYGVYARDYRNAERLSSDFAPLDPISYTVAEWIPGVVYRLFFTLAGPTNSYDTKHPAYFPIVLYCILAVLGIIAFLFTAKMILRNSLARLVLAASLLYIGALIFQVYGIYREGGDAVALNGRYLIPLLPAVAWILIESARQLRIRHVKPYLPMVVGICLIVILLTGGGAGTYIAAGKSDWFFPGFGQSQHELLQPIVSWFVQIRPYN